MARRYKSRKSILFRFSGRKIKADSKKYKIRTFVGNRHIDYILAKKKFLNLKEIIIDFRTLNFLLIIVVLF